VQTHLILAKAVRLVAQISNLLYRRIAFCGGAYCQTSPHSAIASRLQIGDMAEFNSTPYLEAFALSHNEITLDSPGRNDDSFPSHDHF